MKVRRAFEAADQMGLWEESGHIRRKLRVCRGEGPVFWSLEEAGPAIAPVLVFTPPPPTPTRPPTSLGFW